MLAVILAGGKSRRMGRDKALLPFGGMGLLARAAARFREAGFQVAVSQHPLPDTPVIPDLFPGRGPLAGLHAAFSQTEEELIFLTAVDLPLAPPTLASVLLAQMGPEDDACVIRRADGRAEPLFAAYRRSCLPVASALLAAGEGKMRTLLEHVQTRYISEADLTQFDLTLALQNINTVEDYQALFPE